MPKLTYTASNLMLSFLIFCASYTTNNCHAQCSASTQAQFVSCLSSIATSGGSISLTGTINLATNLAVPNKDFTLITNGFNIVTNTMSITVTGNPSMMVTNDGGSLGIYKNGTGATFSGLSANGNLINYAASFNVVLAVDLASFSAKIKEQQVLLSWQTLVGNKLAHFDIECRRADSPFFETIGTIKAANSPDTYTYTDKTPLAINYYRLRQIDQDGKETLSKIVAISTQKQDELKIYPNSVKDQLTIETASDKDFQIVNIFGQEVMHGQSRTQLDLSFLPVGTYIVKIGTKHAKFAKQ
jgi:hypothetical protein